MPVCDVLGTNWEFWTRLVQKRSTTMTSMLNHTQSSSTKLDGVVLVFASSSSTLFTVCTEFPLLYIFNCTCLRVSSTGTRKQIEHWPSGILPDHCCSPFISKGQFRCGLKTHLFQQAYNLWELWFKRVPKLNWTDDVPNFRYVCLNGTMSLLY